MNPEEKARRLKELSELQFHVTQKNGTETPYSHEYTDNYEPGIYVDIVSGEPLFLSIHKFDARCGWPSFTRPIHEESIVEKLDLSHGMVRTEVRSKGGNSHLGHVFRGVFDDPKELDYCINGAALRFIPKEEMEKEGYGEYLQYLVEE